jgi:hypothetical protein
MTEIKHSKSRLCIKSEFSFQCLYVRSSNKESNKTEMHFRNVNILFQFLLVLIIDSIFVVVENGKTFSSLMELEIFGPLSIL